MVLRDELPVKFAVGVVAQLLRDCRGRALNPQDLVFRAKLHDFILGQQIAPGEVVADAGRITRSVAFGLIAGGFLPAGPVPGKDFIKRDTARLGQRTRHFSTDLAPTNAAPNTYVPDGPVTATYRPRDVERENDLEGPGDRGGGHRASLAL